MYLLTTYTWHIHLKISIEYFLLSHAKVIIFIYSERSIYGEYFFYFIEKITCMITDQIALCSVQLPQLILFK